MQAKRIGIACNCLTSGGGMESHAVSIIRELQKNGIEAVIFTKNHKPSPAIPSSVKVFSCSTKYIPRCLEDFYFSNWIKTIKKQEGVDLCIGFCRNTESDILFCGGTHKGYIASGKKHFIYDKVTIKSEEMAFHRAAFILPASKFIARELIDLYNVNLNKISLAYPPIQTEKFKPYSEEKRQKVRSSLGLNTEDTFLLFPAASGHIRKGILFILQCVEDLEKIKIVVAGKPYKSERHSIINIGYQTDMEKVYNAVDFTILASSYEPFGMVGIESVLCGTPVIMADNIGCTEVLSKNACRTFSLNSHDQLTSILKTLDSNSKVSEKDILYDHSSSTQLKLLLSLINQI